MNIVYLIGNGFDIKLGLKTSYKDFYEWYESLSQDMQDPRILSFIKHSREKEKVDKDWSDMELALGKYTAEFKSTDIIEEAKSFHDCLVNAISEYIKYQENKLPVIEKVEELLSHYLTQPEAGERLLVEEYNEFVGYRRNWINSSPWNVQIISFNYTNTIEKLIKYEARKKVSNYFSNGKGNLVLNEIEHIHGYTDSRLILGVNDESQIDNKSLHSTSAMDWYVKPKYNDLCKLGHHKKCQEWIKSAHLICVFGFSLGSTDKQWWEQIVKRMLSENNCWILLFYYDPDNVFTDLQIARREEHKASYKNTFLARAGIALTDSQKKSIINRIYVSYNSDMFKF